MKYVYIYCEGQTEEAFIKNVLRPYFLGMNIYLVPIICSTKRTKSTKHKGGVSSYGKIKKELSALCREHKNEIVTTMFDYYAMPADTPKIDCSENDIYMRMKIIEKAVNDDIGMKNCRFHFMLHEFEGILFSDPIAFQGIAGEDVVQSLQEIRDSAKTPEHINNSPQTAPSKRLKDLIPGYSKVRHGAIISKAIGIDKIMEECVHFRNWINEISD